MTLNTLFPHHQATTADIVRKWQGRSKKKLKPVIEHDGRVFVAHYEGRPNRCFGATVQKAQNNLQAGEA